PSSCLISVSLDATLSIAHDEPDAPAADERLEAHGQSSARAIAPGTDSIDAARSTRAPVGAVPVGTDPARWPPAGSRRGLCAALATGGPSPHPDRAGRRR